MSQVGIVATFIAMKGVPFYKGVRKKFPFDVAGAVLIFFALFFYRIQEKHPKTLRLQHCGKFI